MLTQFAVSSHRPWRPGGSETDTPWAWAVFLAFSGFPLSSPCTNAPYWLLGPVRSEAKAEFRDLSRGARTRFQITTGILCRRPSFLLASGGCAICLTLTAWQTPFGGMCEPILLPSFHPDSIPVGTLTCSRCGYGRVGSISQENGNGICRTRSISRTPAKAIG